MSIRLSKACKDLNVGMTTAVEFLAKKGHKILVDPNLKLSDELHLLLAKEFNKDMALKMESERLSYERHLKEKAATVGLDGYIHTKPVEKQAEVIPVTVPQDQIPQIKSVGHIDLDAKNKPVEPKQQEPVEKKIETVVPKVETINEIQTQEIITLPEKQPIETPVVAAELVIEKIPEKEPEKEIIQEVKPVIPEKVEEPVKPEIQKNENISEKQPNVQVIVEPKEKEKRLEFKKPEKVRENIEKSKEIVEAVINEVEAPEVEEDEEIFTLKRTTIDKTPVIIGTINLDLINQSTRPKPKTKEQKRKEREEKVKQFNKETAENSCQ